MDNILLLAAGILILLFIAYDILFTTLVSNGAGIWTRWLTRKTWSALFLLSGKNARHPLLNHSGMIIVITILFFWVMAIWGSNSLIILSHHDSVVSSVTKHPAGIVEKIYFTGYTLSTLGIGNYVPNGSVWELYTAGISFFGLLFLTLSISYIIPTLSADIQKRNLCIYVSSLGETPQDILCNAWNGRDLSQLATHFENISQQIMLYSQHHLAYPILHYYHSKNRIESPPIALTALDEALTMMLLYIPEHVRPPALCLSILRRAINSYLQTLHGAFITPMNEDPPTPDLEVLKQTDIPLENLDGHDENYNSFKDRRRLLAALVYNDGWQWEDVVQGPSKSVSNKDASLDQEDDRLD